MKKFPAKKIIARLACCAFSFVSLFACPVLASDHYATQGTGHDGMTNQLIVEK